MGCYSFGFWIHYLELYIIYGKQTLKKNKHLLYIYEPVQEALELIFFRWMCQ